MKHLDATPVFHVLLTAFTLLAALARPATAADPDPTTGQDTDLDTAFADVIDVNVVNVDVYVTDKRGRPVTGLTAEDFEVFENRQPMEITNFYAVEDGRRTDRETEPVPDTPDTPAGAPVPPPTPQLEALPVPEDERLRLVIFVDNVNIRPGDRKRVMSRLTRFLLTNVRGRDDQAMVVSYDRSLNIRHPFTSNAAALADALEDLIDKRGEGGQYDEYRKRLLGEIDKAGQAASAMSMIRPYADAIFHDVELTVRALKELVEFLAGLPGRKMVLHVSSGIPMIPASDLFSAVEGKFSDSGMTAMSEFHIYDLSRGFEEVGALANANDVTFHMLDAAGLRVGGTRSAEYEGHDTDRLSLGVDSEYEANLQSPLYFLADRTGGTAIVNQNEIMPALERMASDFRYYYSLGYVAPHSGDGRFYGIKVRVDRKGVVVRHREGYRDKDSTTRMADGTRAALLHPFEQNPLGVGVAFGEPQKSGKSSFVVPMQVQIPVSRIVLMPSPDGTAYIGRVRLFVAAIDPQGDMSEVQETPLALKIPSDVVDAARGELWLYTHQLLMRAGRQKISVGIRDEFGAVESFVSRMHHVEG